MLRAGHFKRWFRLALSLALLTPLFLILGCTKFDLLNATVLSHGDAATKDVDYGPLSRQKLDVYRPAKPAPASRIVVFFYGGNWQTGDKNDYRFVAHALSSRGFVAVLPDYRLYPEVTFPAFVQDAALAVRWVHDHAQEIGGDAKHIYLMGHSAGAHIATLLTLDERYLQEVGLDRTAIRATAALSGPYDFVPSVGDRGVFSMRSDQTSTDPNMQPITFANGDSPPLLLVHGEKDTTVDVKNATRLATAIKNAGGEVRVVTYPKRAHVGVVLSLAASFRWLAPTLNDVAKFFQEQN